MENFTVTTKHIKPAKNEDYYKEIAIQEAILNTFKLVGIVAETNTQEI